MRSVIISFYGYTETTNVSRAQILARNTDAILISKNLKLGNKNYDVTHQFHHTFWYGLNVAIIRL